MAFFGQSLKSDPQRQQSEPQDLARWRSSAMIGEVSASCGGGMAASKLSG